MKSKIKLLLYCGLMIMTLNAFALNIDTWSKPVEFHSNNFSHLPGEVWGEHLPIVVGGNKIVYIGYDRIEYNKQYDVSYRVCELDKNTGEQKLVKQTPIADYAQIAGLFAQYQFHIYFKAVAIPNSNSFIDFLFLGNPDWTIKSTMYRVGTIHSDYSITWTKLKELNINFNNSVYVNYVQAAVTPTKNIVFLAKGVNGAPAQVFTGKLIQNTEIVDIRTTSVEVGINTSYANDILNIKNEYLAMFISNNIVLIGKFNETGTMDWGEPQYLDYGKTMSINNQLAIENSDSSGSFLKFYNININLTISKDEASETMNLPSMCKNEYDWDVNWIEGEDKLLTTVYIYDDVNSTQSIYYSEANIVNKL